MIAPSVSEKGRIALNTSQGIKSSKIFIVLFYYFCRLTFHGPVQGRPFPLWKGSSGTSEKHYEDFIKHL